MNTDSIVQEVREARASIAAEFGYDLSKYLVWIREQTKLRKEALASSPPSLPQPPPSGMTKSAAPRTRKVRSANALV